MEKTTTPISIYPDEELRRNLEDLAGEEVRSLNNLILLILKRHFKYKKGLTK